MKNILIFIHLLLPFITSAQLNYTDLKQIFESSLSSNITFFKQRGYVFNNTEKLQNINTVVYVKKDVQTDLNTEYVNLNYLLDDSININSLTYLILDPLNLDDLLNEIKLLGYKEINNEIKDNEVCIIYKNIFQLSLCESMFLNNGNEQRYRYVFLKKD